MIVSRILKTMAILDWPARSNPYNNRLINDAANMAQGSSSQAFKILTDIVRVFTITAGTITQMAFLKRALTSENGDLFAIGLFTNLLSTGNWLLQGGILRYLFEQFTLADSTTGLIDNGVQWAVTNTDYQRMQHIWKDSIGSPESILLDLPRYLHGEFKKANERLGDVATSRIGEVNHVAQAAKILKSFSQPLLYALFALRAASRRGKTRRPNLLFQATFSTSALYAIDSATWALTDEIGGLFCVLESVR